MKGFQGNLPMIYPSWESKGQCHAPPKRHLSTIMIPTKTPECPAFLGLALELFPWIFQLLVSAELFFFVEKNAFPSNTPRSPPVDKVNVNCPMIFRLENPENKLPKQQKNNISGWMTRRLNFKESKNKKNSWTSCSLVFTEFEVAWKQRLLKRFNFTLNVVTRIGVKRQAIQFVYSGWFLLELVLRFAVDGRKLFYGEDGRWIIIDLKLATGS